MATKKKWIKKAIKKPGAFKEYCGGEVTESCIQRGLKSPNVTVQRRARLARTLAKMRKKRK